MPIPPNFGDVLTQTGLALRFWVLPRLEQRLAVFCAPEARLLVCRSPALPWHDPDRGTTGVSVDCLTKELDQQSTLANTIRD
jgi:hypothetical protein